MLYGGFVMDRLEIRQIHPASIPGLVPMILGAALMLCSLLLYVSSRGKADDAPEAVKNYSWSDFLVAAGWSVVFALGLVGTIPFGVAVTIYIAGFILYFGWPPAGADNRQKVKLVGLSVVLAIATAVGVSALFRYGFLVRLP